MANIYVGDFIATAEIIIKVCNKAFSEQLRPHKSYENFYGCVQQWTGNLRRLARVIKNAADQQSLCGNMHPDEEPIVDQLALMEIIDDCRPTFEECKETLRQTEPYEEERGGGINQLIFNESKRPKIEQLTERIKAHDARLHSFLKPYEFDLLQKMYQKINDIHNVTVRGILIGKYEPRNQRPTCRPDHSLPVPESFQRIFQTEGDRNDRKLSIKGPNTLAPWVEAVAVHLRNSTQLFKDGGLEIADRTVPLAQYTNLLKCLWLLQKLESHQSLDNVGKNSHWPSYITQLTKDVSNQCRRFNQEVEDLRAPDPLLPNPSLCGIWPKEVNILPEVCPEPTTMVSRLMTAQLRSDRAGAKIHMVLTRVFDTRMKVTMIGYDTSNDRDSIAEQNYFEFDTKTVHIIQYFAMPGWGGNGYDTLVKTETNRTILHFQQLEDALRFQQAITGFKVYGSYSEGPVDIVCVLQNNRKSLRKGFIQFWIPKELREIPELPDDYFTEPGQNLNVSGGESSETETLRLERTVSQISDTERVDNSSRNSFANGSVRSIPGRRPQIRTMSTPQVTVPDWLSNCSVKSKARSISSRKSSTWSTITKIDHGDGTYGFLRQRPIDPMLVLFLYDESPNRKGSGLSFLTIKIDQQTDLMPHRCRCKTEKQLLCTHALIERMGKDKMLRAELYEAYDKLDWDVTQLGFSKREGQSNNRLDGLIRLSIKFGPPGDKDAGRRRNDFAGNCNCRTENAGELRKCLEEHPRLFKEVWECGQREWRTWNNGISSSKMIMTGDEALAAYQSAHWHFGN